jgi:Cu2+-exporting ATPase
MDAIHNQDGILELSLIGVLKPDGIAALVQDLQNLKDLSEVVVEIEVNRLKYKTNSDENLPDVVQVIRKHHLNVVSTTQIFPVLGMSCASCASSAETIVRYLPGVISSAVNFASGKLKVEYLPTLLDVKGIQEALQSVGYDIVLEESEFSQDRSDERQHALLKSLQSKTLWAVIFTLPVFVLGMFFMNVPYANEIMWFFSTPVVFWFGRDFFVQAWKQLKRGSSNMDTLVALSTGIAYVFSVFNLLFPSFWHQSGIHAHVYFETAAVIICFIMLGKLLEERAKAKTTSSIRKLMGMQPKSVWIIDQDNLEKEVLIETVQVGDKLIAKPGERIAVDGIVLRGSSFVDESFLSGEPLPVQKSSGERVFTGTINQKGSFVYQAEKLGKDTVLAHIITLVQEAQGSKARVQRVVDQIASIFVPTLIGIALLTFGLWFWLDQENGLIRGLLAAITVLIIACPCALGLATPTAIMVGVGKAAELGILIKDASSLEVINQIDTIILDKTGTITQGKPSVTDVFWLNNDTNAQPILLALEKHSEHPLAEAVVSHFSSSDMVDVFDFQSITGKGVKASFENQTYFVGNEKLLREMGVSLNEEMLQYASRLSKEAKTVIWFSNSVEALAILAIRDELKPTSVKAIEQLQHLGISVHMLTGDHIDTATAVANQTKISDFSAGMLPSEKAAYIETLKTSGKKVAMVGDGINDSAALAKADVSIAMGKGSDIAMDVAMMTIVSSELTKIPMAIQLSKQTVKTIRLNLFWAFIYNIIGIPIAAGILYPINGFVLNPMIAGAAMAMSSVSVVSNSLWLKFKKINSK